MDLELRDRVVLVTGGSDGLGAALARTLVAEGARVAICARDRTRLDAAAEGLRAAGGTVLAVQADVSRADGVERFVSGTLERWGRIDGLVNNAGTSAARLFGEVTDEDWERDLRLKLFAAVWSSRLAHDALAVSGSGAVVNVLNIGAKAPGPRSMPTTVSRAAGMAFTKALSKEWGPEGIRVNAILIGLVESGQWRRRAEAQGIPLADLTARMAREANIPLGRMGKAEEFADLAAFLLSARSAYLTGAAINFDGGSSAVV